MYPNPTQTSFKMIVNSKKSNQLIKARIINFQGRTIETINFKSGENISFGERLNRGIYFIEIREGEKIKVIRALKF